VKTLLNTLYVQTQGAYLRLEGDTLKLEAPEQKDFQIPLHHLGGIVVFGNVLLSPYLIKRCAEDGRTVVWMSRSGRFVGNLRSPTSGNVLLRRAQHNALTDAAQATEIARMFVAGKLQNTRTLLTRAARETKSDEVVAVLNKVRKSLTSSLVSLERQKTLDEIRGVEGESARLYFSVFDFLILTNKKTFCFTHRNKRPPRDPINALMSFTYALLANECQAACEGVGLDPQIGYLHALRPGRPSLALDLMEELRSIFADRFVLSLVNRRQITDADFLDRPGGSVELTEKGRKTFLVAYQKKKQEELRHPILKQSIPYALLPHIQARLLARYLRQDISVYPPFIAK
jgi:CRISPR-associated protein Cas1